MKPEHLAQFPGSRIEAYNLACRQLAERLQPYAGLMQLRVDEFDWPADSYANLEFLLLHYRVHAWVSVNGQRLNISQTFSRLKIDYLADDALPYIVHTWAHALAKGILEPPKQ